MGLDKGAEIIKIYVGQCDNPEQLTAEGWNLFGYGLMNPGVRHLLSSARNVPVLIQGEDAGMCVGDVVITALTLGCNPVEVPLGGISTWGEGEDPLKLRAKRLAFKLRDFEDLDFTHLKISPKDIWESAKANVLGW